MAFVPGINQVSGTVSFTGVTMIPAGVQLVGAPGTVFRAPPGPEGFAFKCQSDNVSLKNIRFEGGGVFFESPGRDANDKIEVDNCEFSGDIPIPAGKTGNLNFYANGITFTQGLKNSKIVNSRFTMKNGFGLFGYNYRNLRIANNEFVDSGGGMHIDAQRLSGDLIVAENYMTRLASMGLEFQGKGERLQFIDNWFDNPSAFSDHAMAYSLILAQSPGPILIARNYAHSLLRPDGKGTRVAFEVGGDNCLVTDNHSVGFFNVLANNDGEGTGSVTVRDNHMSQYINAAYIAFPRTDRWMRMEGVNGPSYVASWLARGRPRRGVPFNVTPAPLPPPPVDPLVELTKERDALKLLAESQATKITNAKVALG